MDLFNEYRLTRSSEGTSFKIDPDGPIDITIPENFVGNGMGNNNRMYFAGTLEEFNTFKGYSILLGYTGSYHHIPEDKLLTYLPSVPTKYFFSTPSYMNKYTSIFSFY